jgi:DNA-binding transcriptional ArsR family regulator
VRTRAARSTDEPRLAEVPRDGAVWELLTLLLRAPDRRLGWAHAAQALAVDVETVTTRARALAQTLQAAAIDAETTTRGLVLRASHFVFVYPSSSLPETSRRILAMLARSPGATAVDLTTSGAALRTVQRHLAALRAAGYLRRVGGGRDARYALV